MVARLAARNKNGSGSYGTLTSMADWTLAGGAPGLDGGAYAATDTATFDNTALASGSSATVSLNGASPSLKAVTFNTAGGGGYTLAQGSGGTLTFNNGGSNAILTDSNGNHTISAPVVLASNLAYTGGASVKWELAANTTTNANPNAIFDTIVVAKNLSFEGLTNLNLSFNPVGGNVIWSDPFWQTNRTGIGGWLLYDAAGTINNFENLKLVAANWQDSEGNLFHDFLATSSFSLYQNGSKIYLDYSTVTTPEPSSGVAMAVVALLGSTAFLGRRRRTRSTDARAGGPRRTTNGARI